MRARLVRSSPLGSHRAASALVAAAAVCAAAGCGSSGSSSNGEFAPNGSFDTAAAPGPAAAAPSAIPTAELYKTVLERYRAYQDAYKTAYDTNDPSGLTDVAMDPLLTTVTDDVEATKAKGVIWRFANTFNPRVYARSKDSTKVYVIDCVRTLAAYRYSAKTGKQLDKLSGGAFVYRATVQYDSGTWKVAANVRDRQC
ncbi:hypothetical protein [Actinomadura bangladeshensis]|uniref:Nuclear transport factor 2 family protein n=1 Tax=Actinomadura bangladeshensis TaxID=453573 RepID=A0A6L9QY01_9ACTN|nr:hypothetical protein [Actinomadura bangladeshensis]NEA29802.1 hypothetical protein [Actinomadura bangladeshensis]